jgi:SMC interacting uncharacterized protein involved in chromosome segregation
MVTELLLETVVAGVMVCLQEEEDSKAQQEEEALLDVDQFIAMLTNEQIANVERREEDLRNNFQLSIII